jgi:thiamine-phosphate pyrophosphorylase
MIRCAITDGSRFGADADARFAGLMADAARWAKAGIEFVQLREKAIDAGELLRVGEGMVRIFREYGGVTKLLVNGRVDVAVATGADGVHLTSAEDELTAEQVRRVFPGAMVSASCHSLADVERARDGGVDLILFGPVFEKRVDGRVVVEGVGLEVLRKACVASGEVPVLALGGVTDNNIAVCLDASAAGVAAIRLFS